MKKIIVIGCPGSGKSTFSKALHMRTNIPLHHLDMLYWNSDKTVVEKSIFLERLLAILKTNQWIIDGNYSATMEMRMRECDTIIFLDFPTEVCLQGIDERKGKVRSDMPCIAPDDDDDFIDFIKSYNIKSRPQVLGLLHRYSKKNILIFKSRKEADAFLKKTEA